MPGLKDKIEQKAAPAPVEQATPAPVEQAAPAPVEQAAPAPSDGSDISRIVAAVMAAVNTHQQQDKMRSSAKPLAKVKVDQESLAQAKELVKQAGNRWYFLSAPRYIQDARWNAPRLVQASFQAQARVLLSSMIVRIDRATGKAEAVARTCGEGIAEGPIAVPVDPRVSANQMGQSVVAAYGPRTPAAPVDVEGPPVVDPFGSSVVDADSSSPLTPGFVPPAGNPVSV